MKLRPYQQKAVDRSLKALSLRNNTLLVSPVGSGKTFIMSFLITEFLKKVPNAKVLVLQHRIEILRQNKLKFEGLNDTASVGVFCQEEKDFAQQVTFAMVQTLIRSIEQIPNIDLLVIDEAHHVVADTYIDIVEHAKEQNPGLKIFGVTATPNRSDRTTLARVFNNISYSIDIDALVEAGVLVPPRPYVLDIGIQKDLKLLFESGKPSEGQINDFLDDNSFRVDLEKAYSFWNELARGRKTVIFAPSINYSKMVSEVFSLNDVKNSIITGDTPAKERQEILNQFENFDLSVLINTSVLTEGWDCPVTSCVVLFNNTTFKSSYIQMLGRGLRSCSGKQDCIILDFGISTVLHGDLCQNVFNSISQDDDLQKVDKEQEDVEEEEDYKICPECFGHIPEKEKVCGICSYVYPNLEQQKKLIEQFKMKEVELIKKIKEKCPYIFHDVFSDETTHIACLGIKDFIGITKEREKWYVFSNLYSFENGIDIHDELENLSECYLLAYKLIRSYKGKNTAFKKRKEWLELQPTDKQIAIISKNNYRLKNINSNRINRYQASCLLTYLFNNKKFVSAVREWGKVY
jgi:superfamily II DNA or RNA helicase